MNEFNESSHRLFHDKVMDKLDDHGCAYGGKQVEILKAKFEDHCVKQASDIGDAKAIANVALQLEKENRNTYEEFKTTFSISIEKKIDSLKKAFDALWWKVLLASMLGNGVLFGILLSLFLNHINNSK